MNLTDEDTSSLLDVTQIGQVLMNLATNARDAMPARGLADHHNRTGKDRRDLHRRPTDSDVWASM